MDFVDAYGTVFRTNDGSLPTAHGNIEIRTPSGDYVSSTWVGQAIPPKE